MQEGWYGSSRFTPYEVQVMAYGYHCGGYPLGAENDPRAPWNERDEDEEGYFDEVEADDRRHEND